MLRTRDLFHRCSERNMSRKNFRCHGTVITMGTTAYPLNSVDCLSVKVIFFQKIPFNL